jgi:hypothetical protein
MKSSMFIPKKIKAGFQKRNSTYTGHLAYVIYYDQKDVLRKEVSWNNWRDKKIDPMDTDNEPTEGFVLNKKVGGYKSDWNYRQSYARVYDPRGFEFEITLDNLLFILAECNCSKGKGLEGEFVYAWAGTDLVLLPVSCETYRECFNFTKLQDKNISVRDLKIGGVYKTRSESVFTYLGRFDFTYISKGQFRKTKKHIASANNDFFVVPSNVAEYIGDDSDVAFQVEAYQKDLRSKTILSSSIQEHLPDSPDRIFVSWTDTGNGNYSSVRVYNDSYSAYNYNKPPYAYNGQSIKIDKGIIIKGIDVEPYFYRNNNTVPVPDKMNNIILNFTDGSSSLISTYFKSIGMYL